MSLPYFELTLMLYFFGAALFAISLAIRTNVLSSLAVGITAFGFVLHSAVLHTLFFGTEHTMERYENAFYAPLLSDWQNNERWVEAGAKDSTQRATEIWQSVIQSFEPPELDQGRLESIDEYVEIRKKEIGSGDIV